MARDTRTTLRTLHVERAYTTAAGGRVVITTHYDNVPAAAFHFDAWDAAAGMQYDNVTGRKIERYDTAANGDFLGFVIPPHIPAEWDMRASVIITACWM